MIGRRCWPALLVPALFLLPAAATGADQPDPQFARAVEQAKASMMTNPARAVLKGEEAARRAATLAADARPVALATAEWLQAEGLLRLNQAGRAGTLIGAALARLTKADASSDLYGELLAARGLEASENGRTAQALSYYQSAYRVFLRASNNRSRARTLISIAIIYDEAYDHGNALRYYRQALDAYRGDPLFSYSIYGNIGQTLKEQKRYEEAEDQTRRALALAREIGSPGMIAHTLDNLARIHLAEGRLAQADHDIAQAMPLIARSDDDFGSLVATAAQAALQHRQIAQAVSLIDQSFAGIDPARTPLGMRERHETAYDVYRTAGDTDRALVHLSAMKRLDDEATRLATSTNAALMGARFDFANQELRIAKLKADDAARRLTFERARAQTQRWVFVGVIAAITVVVALLVMGLRKLRRSRNEVARANIVLGETNEALGKALAAKTEFLATTSHEIRTPLNGILGMTQVMLASPSIDPAVRERIGIVHTAGLTMRSLVDDILDAAKMETGHLAIESVPLDLCRTLTELVKLWREQAGAKGLAFEADLTDCPACVEGDVARLRQVVFNLLGNAIKFTEVGKVSLRAWQVDGVRPRYRIAITDTGIGVAADKLDLIFESFQQGDTSTTRRFGGTGLGLAISRRLARAMGGDVTVTSEPGAGSTFTLDLPLVDAHPVGVDPQTPVPAPTVLVVERNPIARGMYKALLAPHFDAVRFAGTPDEARHVLAGGRVLRVLADDATLRADGDLAAALGLIAAAGVPVALLWSPHEHDDRESLIAAGAAPLLQKPVSRSDLLTILTGNMDQSLDDLVYRAA